MKHWIGVILIAGLFWTTTAVANEKDDKVWFTTVDPSWKSETLPGSQFKVQRPNQDSTDLLPKERDRLFAEAGIQAEIQGWDQLAKNMLMLRASYKTLNQMKSLYPKISEKKLGSLMSIARDNHVEGRI